MIVTGFAQDGGSQALFPKQAARQSEEKLLRVSKLHVRGDVLLVAARLAQDGRSQALFPQEATRGGKEKLLMAGFRTSMFGVMFF